MNIQKKDKFIEATASNGMYIVDGDILFGMIAYLPINYDTSKLREIAEEEKWYYSHQEQIKIQ